MGVVLMMVVRGVVSVGALATATDSRTGTFEALLWLGGIILVVILAAGVVAGVRRHMLGSPRRDGGGLSLEQIRRWKDEGTVTPAEYEALRQRAVADLRRSLSDKR